MKLKGYSVPFLSLLPFFIVGIVFKEFIPWNIGAGVLSAISIVLLLFLLIFQKKYHHWKYGFKALTSLLLFLLGVLAHKYQDNSSYNDFYQVTTQVDFSLVKIVKQAGSSKDYVKYHTNLEYVVHKKEFNKSRAGLILYLPKEDSVRYFIGDKLIINKAPLALPEKRNPYEFDYKKYLSRKGIDYQILGKRASYFRYKEGEGFIHGIDKIRNRLLVKLKENLRSEQAGLASALILGFRDDLSKGTLNTFQNTGSMHVLAVSGLHLGILFIMLSYLFKISHLRLIPKSVQFVIIAGALWFYVFLSGMSISVIRAAIMFTVVQLGISLNRKGNIYNSLFFSAFVVLLIFPRELFQVGFQFSYLAVLGIVFFHTYINNWFEFRFKWINYLWSIVAVAISAQLSIGVLSAYYFHSFPFVFPLSNIVVILSAMIQMLIGFIFILFSGIDILATWFGYLLDLLFSIELWALERIDSIPNSIIKGIYFTPVEMILYYVLIFAIFFFLVNKSFKALSIGLAVLFCIGMVGVWKEVRLMKQDKIVLFGANDICLAYLKKEKAYLYTGARVNEKAIAFYTEPYLNNKGIKEINMIKEGESFTNAFLKVMPNGHIRMKDKFFYHYKGSIIKSLLPDEIVIVPKHKIRRFRQENFDSMNNVYFLTENKGKKQTNFFKFKALFAY